MSFEKSLILLAVVLFSGCAQYRWEQPGASQGKFDVDKYACEMDAATIYPVKMVNVKLNDQVIPGNTRCNSSGNGNIYGGNISTNTVTTCNTTPDKVILGATVFTRDDNLKARGDLINSCMRSRGWSLVRYK